MAHPFTLERRHRADQAKELVRESLDPAQWELVADYLSHEKEADAEAWTDEIAATVQAIAAHFLQFAPAILAVAEHLQGLSVEQMRALACCTERR
jgi:hypothetical protein